MAWNTIFTAGGSQATNLQIPQTQTPQPRRVFAEKYRSSTWFIVISVMIANFMDVFIYSAIVPVAPFVLPTRVGIAPDKIQRWIAILLAVSYIVNIIVSLPCAWISDKIGARRPMFFIGAIVQGAALASLTAGTNIAFWVIGRALQGLAYAIIFTTTLPLLLEASPKNQHGRYLGLFGFSTSAGLIFGPLIGGVMYDRCGYYPLFCFLMVLNFLDSIMRLAIIEKKIVSPRAEAEEVELEQGNITQDGSNISKPPSVRTTQVDASSITSLTSNADKRRITSKLSSIRNHSVIIDLLCSKRILTALYVALLYTTIQTCFDATLPLFVSHTFKWTSLGSGLIFIPFLASDFCSPLFGIAVDKLGAKRVCSAGFLISITPLVCLRFVEKNSIEHKVLLAALLAMTGFGLAAVLPAAMVEVGAVIEEKGLMGTVEGDVGAVSRSYGLFNIGFTGGCLVGSLFGGLTTEAAGWHTMVWILALIWATGIVPVLLWMRSKK